MFPRSFAMLRMTRSGGYVPEILCYVQDDMEGGYVPEILHYAPF